MTSLAPADSVGAALVRGDGLCSARPWVAQDGIHTHWPGWADTPMPADAPRSVSVVVPAWASRRTLPACVASLHRAALAVRGHCEVEIIVVDDGDAHPAFDALEDAPGCDGTRILRTDHGGQSRASNAGALVARGEALVLCDSDMVLHPWALDQLLRALTFDTGLLAFGFRENVAGITANRVAHGRPLTERLYLCDDNRVRFDTPGYPSSLVSATRELRDLTHGRRVQPPGRLAWSLPTMAYGCLLACSREAFLELGGFDGRFVDWGFADTELTARWIASGRAIAPVFTASALHISHRVRHPLQWRRFETSRNRYEAVLAGEWQRTEFEASPVRDDRRTRGTAPSPPGPPPELSGACVAARAAVVGDLGLFERAAGPPERAALGGPLASAALQVLRLSGSERYLRLHPDGGAPDDARAALEQGLLRIAHGDLCGARLSLEQARRSRDADWSTRGCANWLMRRHARRSWAVANEHLAQGLTRAAASGWLACLAADDGARFTRDCEAALAGLPPAERRIV